MVIMSLKDICCLTDSTRSTRDQSKQRRVLMKEEVDRLRNLLPLPESARNRLPQLQVMSLLCVYIRKCEIMNQVFGDIPFNISLPFDFFATLPGFMLVITCRGKLVYISENVSEYLGHSMVDIKTQGDSINEMIDERDKEAVESILSNKDEKMMSGEDVTFFCRMKLSRCVRRQISPSDVKVMRIKGHFVPTASSSLPSSMQSLFVGICTPVLSPENVDAFNHYDAMIFKTSHSPDMKFINITSNGEHYLGLSKEQLTGLSWYNFIHPENVREASECHRKLISVHKDRVCSLVVRMIQSNGDYLWVNCVMNIHSYLDRNVQELIVCTYQVLSEQEVYQYKGHNRMISQCLDHSSWCNISLNSFVHDNMTEQRMDAMSATPNYQVAPKRRQNPINSTEHEHVVKALKIKLDENASVSLKSTTPLYMDSLTNNRRPQYQIPSSSIGSFSPVTFSPTGDATMYYNQSQFSPPVNWQSQEQVVPSWTLSPESSPYGSPASYTGSMWHPPMECQKLSSSNDLPVLTSASVENTFHQIRAEKSEHVVFNSRKTFEPPPVNSDVELDDIFADYNNFVSSAVDSSTVLPYYSNSNLIRCSSNQSWSSSSLSVTSSIDDQISFDEAEDTLAFLTLPSNLISPHYNLKWINNRNHTMSHC